MFKIPSDYVKDFLSLLYEINDLNKQSDINHYKTDLCIEFIIVKFLFTKIHFSYHMTRFPNSKLCKIYSRTPQLDEKRQ